MKLSYIDTSNFLRGLLILIKKDNIIHEKEIELLNKFGEVLGFEEEFYETAVKKFLTKRNIDSSIPKFSSNKVTIQFNIKAIKKVLIKYVAVYNTSLILAFISNI